MPAWPAARRMEPGRAAGKQCLQKVTANHSGAWSSPPLSRRSPGAGGAVAGNRASGHWPSSSIPLGAAGTRCGAWPDNAEAPARIGHAGRWDGKPSWQTLRAQNAAPSSRGATPRVRRGVTPAPAAAGCQRLGAAPAATPSNYRGTGRLIEGTSLLIEKTFRSPRPPSSRAGGEQGPQLLEMATADHRFCAAVEVLVRPGSGRSRSFSPASRTPPLLLHAGSSVSVPLMGLGLNRGALVACCWRLTTA